ncbi:MAG: Colicin receptor precursor [Verrucomicrobiota bacterium]|jgi:TonB-dependent receptor
MNNMIPSPSAARQTWLALLVGIVLSVTAVQAQTASGILAGRVRDGSGNPLASARVAVVNTNLQAVTERDGDYYLGTVPAGNYTVRVSYLGLPARDELVVVTAGERTTLNVRLGVADSDEVVQLEAMSIEGQRAGQARALNLQRASENLKEIVAADAIGRFPDQNTAEAMQRLSGVALERDQGEGRFISIRGMSADLNNTQINGVNVPSSERNTRKVNLDTIPSEQLDSIELTKALTPDMDGDAIGGSVNLKTKTAFSQEGRILNFSAEGQYNRFRDKWGHKYATTMGGRFADERWGLLVAVSDQVRYFSSLDNEYADGWETKNGFSVPMADLDIREYHVRRIRRGGSFSLDYRPSADDELFLRGSYNHFSDFEHRFRMRFRSRTANLTPSSDTAGTVTGRPVQTDLKDRTEDTNIWVLSTGGQHQRGSLRIDWLAARSYADLKDPYRFEPVFQSGNTSFAYDVSNESRPVITGAWANLPLTNFRMNALRLRHANHSDEESTFALNLRGERDWGQNPGYWKVGIKFRQREKNVDTDDNRFTDATGGAFTLANVYRPSTFNAASNPFLTVDPVAMNAYFRSNPGSFNRNATTSAIGSLQEDYVSNEDVWAGYAMGSVTMDRFTLLGGVRVESTSFKTNGWEIRGTVNPVFTRRNSSRSYASVLPSVHGVYKISDKAQWRASYAKSISRPNFADSAFRVSISDTNDYSQGNPQLKPYSADNIDASIEFYPGKSLGVISFGAFAKRIDDFIFSQTILGGAPNGVNNLTTPLNGKTAKINGLEVTYQQQFAFLPAPFDGLGFFSNLTFTNGRADLGDARPGERMPFAGQSKRIANLALSYEKHGFLLRASLNFRSAYLNDIGGAPDEDVYVDRHQQIDVTTSYKITSRVSVFAEFLNMNNRPYRAYYGESGGTQKHETYKWAANTGIKLNF